MREIYESFQRVLEKGLSQATGIMLAALFSAASLSLPINKHTARIGLLFLAALSAFASVFGILLRYNSHPRFHCARYGGGTFFDDVRPQFRRFVRLNQLHILVENQTFGGADYDPCPNVPKSLIVEYSIHGDRKFKIVEESTKEKKNYIDLN